MFGRRKDVELPLRIRRTFPTKFVFWIFPSSCGPREARLTFFYRLRPIFPILILGLSWTPEIQRGIVVMANLLGLLASLPQVRMEMIDFLNISV